MTLSKVKPPDIAFCSTKTGRLSAACVISCSGRMRGFSSRGAEDQNANVVPVTNVTIPTNASSLKLNIVAFHGRIV